MPVEANPQRSGGADVLFDLELDGATPAGIPVEPSAVLFEAPESGFGSLFGDVAQPGQAPNVAAKRVPEAPVERSGQPDVRVGASQPTQTYQAEASVSRAPIPTQPVETPTQAYQAEAPGSRAPMQRQPGEAPQQTHQVETPGSRGALPRQPGEPQSAPPQDANMRTVSLSHTSAGQPISPEHSQIPVARRPGSKSESEALSELAQSVGSPRNSGPVGDDTSLSDLAAATGLRRNTAPQETPTSTQPHRSAPPTGWEQAHEYPVLIPGPDENRRFRMRWPLVVLLLLALVTTAGYFLGFQKWISSGKTPTAEVTPPVKKLPEVQPTPVATAHDPVSKPPETTPVIKPPEPAPTPTVVKPDPAPPEVPPTGSVDSAQARYSLQAASFPKEVQAKEFSDKLVRAGVPAYIMSIDIPRRGKWFRVRVGRFPSADEAGKYAPQARQRARAAGISLELIVCDFEKS